MNWGMLIAGFIFLSNPVITVVDILPDAIGFFLIAAGLTKPAYYVGETAKAREGMMKLGLLEVVKFFSILLLPSISGSGKLLLTFVFGLLELMWFIPAVIAMFEGFGFLGLWYGGDGLYAKKIKKNGKVIERITATRNYIIFFYILRVVMTLIPELTELQMYDYIGSVNTLSVQLINYKPSLYLLTAFFTIIFGIILIVKTTKYFAGAKKDKKLAEGLDNKFKNDILTKKTLFIAKNMKNALWLFALAAVCEFAVFADGVNLIVGAIPAALLITASLLIRKYEKNALAVIPFAAVRAVLSVVNCVIQVNYYAEYSMEAIDWITNAYDAYYKMAALNAAEEIFALASVVVFLAVVMKAAKKHLSEFGVQSEHMQYSKKNRDLETYNTIGAKLLMCLIFALVNFGFAAAYNYMATSVSLTTVIDSCVTIVYIAYVIFTVNTINELLYDKELELV